MAAATGAAPVVCPPAAEPPAACFVWILEPVTNCLDDMQNVPLARSFYVFECVSVSGRPVFREAVRASRVGGETVVLRSA